MARTKQTARKNIGGKPLAMGRGKNPGPKPKPKPGWVDRKVIIKYSSDEEFDEDNPQPVVGTGAPKRVVRQIHLTLSTSPTHVTTTESFKTFFINHGLMKALQKAFHKRGWSTDQMQELMANFKTKYKQTIPLPKIFEDEDSSKSEGLELQDGMRYGRKTGRTLRLISTHSDKNSNQRCLATVCKNIIWLNKETTIDVRNRSVGST